MTKVNEINNKFEKIIILESPTFKNEYLFQRILNSRDVLKSH